MLIYSKKYTYLGSNLKYFLEAKTQDALFTSAGQRRNSEAGFLIQHFQVFPHFHIHMKKTKTL